MTRRTAIGIDLGGTNLKGGLVDDAGQLVKREIRPTHLSAGPDALIQQIVSFVDMLVSRGRIERTDLAGVGVGTPGPLSPREGRIHRAGNLPGWEDIPLASLLLEKLDLPVAIDNDANLAALGEAWVGAGRDITNIALLTLGTGIGGGFVQAGKVFHGHFENAAELGHMIVVPQGLLCSCGQRGCLERYASAAAVAHRAVDAVRNGASSSLTEVIEAGEAIDSKRVVEHAKAGDELALQFWDEACRYLAIACINLQHTFNPARVILGGGMSGAGAFLLDRVRDHFARLKWRLHDDYPEIVLAELGNDGGTIGAARLILSRSQ
jgi:glucokinase